MDTKTAGDDAATEFLTAAEVAAWLRVGLSTVYAWTASGRIPCFKFNGAVRFQRKQLREWMQQHSSCPSASLRNVSESLSGTRPRPLPHYTMSELAARVKKRLFSAEKPIHHGDVR
jgi:excisionase family DNA binding protein